jgi:hypothetical protein
LVIHRNEGTIRRGESEGSEAAAEQFAQLDRWRCLARDLGDRVALFMSPPKALAALMATRRGNSRIWDHGGSLAPSLVGGGPPDRAAPGDTASRLGPAGGAVSGCADFPA